VQRKSRFKKVRSHFNNSSMPLVGMVIVLIADKGCYEMKAYSDYEKKN